MGIVKITSQSIIDRSKTFYNEVFRIKYNKNKYLISSHCCIPIENCSLENGEFITPFIDSNWNEILIFKDSPNFKTKSFEKLKYIFKNDSEVFVNDNKVEFIKYGEYQFNYQFNNYPETLYYVLKTLKKSDLIIGSPVYLKEDNSEVLLGFISYFTTEIENENPVYKLFCIPCYYIIKTLIRYNKCLNFLALPSVKEANKIEFTSIDGLKITNSKISSRQLGQSIHPNTYLLLETNHNTKLKSNNNSYEIDVKELKGTNYLKNSEKIVEINKSKFLLTTRLMKLLEYLDSDFFEIVYDLISYRLLKNNDISNMKLDTQNKLRIFI